MECSGCGFENREGKRFCVKCGTALALKCHHCQADLGGSTSFGERTDAELAREVMARYHAILQDVIDAHAGTVAKFMGDGMMATFGIPEIAEDDARRAVDAGAVLQPRFEEFAAEVDRRHGHHRALNTDEGDLDPATALLDQRRQFS